MAIAARNPIEVIAMTKARMITRITGQGSAISRGRGGVPSRPAHRPGGTRQKGA
jgi:hypothetical protein